MKTEIILCSAIAAALSFAMLGGFAFAVGFGIPHQFYGNVLINNGLAPEGTTVSAKIDGTDTKSTTTTSGKYGYSPNAFYVEDPNNINTGKTIYFYVNGVQAGTYTFANGKSTQLDLAITVAESQSSSSTGSSSSGGGGGGGGGSQSSTQPRTNATDAGNTGTATASAPSGPCQEKWTCDAWSACESGLQKRNCTDANKCGTTYDLPLMSQPCGTEKAASSTESPKVSAAAPNPGMITGLVTSIASPAGVGAIALILVAGYGFYRYSRNGRQKDR